MSPINAKVVRDSASEDASSQTQTVIKAYTGPVAPTLRPTSGAIYDLYNDQQKKIVQAVKKLYSSDVMEQFAGASSLKNVAVSWTADMSFFAYAGAIPPLVQFLRSESPQLQYLAARTLLCMARTADVRHEVGDAAGAISSFVHMLKSGPTSSARDVAAAVLRALAMDDAFKQVISKHGAYQHFRMH